MEAAERRLRNAVGSSWYEEIGHLLTTPEMKEVATRVNARRKAFSVKVQPDREDTFRAFQLTQFKDVKVVVVGDEPSNILDDADGLAFSHKDPFQREDDVQNMASVIESTVSLYNGLKVYQEADLTHLALQGVFLLNSVLTVEEGKEFSHQKFGWDWFTDRVLEKLLCDPEPKAFMFWGEAPRNAFLRVNEKLKLKPSTCIHKLMFGPHPSDEKFKEINHFEEANQFIAKYGHNPIKW